MTMPQGKPISEEVQWIVVRLGTVLLPEDVAMYLNISERKIRAILTHHKRTGEVDTPRREQPNIYRKLQAEDIEVSLSYQGFYPLY